MFRALRKHWFLMSQLIERDFKTRYRRSFLGVLWSVLNPLLTMMVQFFVFSRLFRFDIPYYAVYLLSGIVLFNYLSEATSQSMTCIIQNASLINKVYVPKIIYPMTRVLSSGVNFLFALLAMYFVILISGLPVTWVHLALLFDFLCLYVFINGLSFLLASIMVFFHDTQFLYGVVLTIWIYLTPIFYPESILPPEALSLIRFNPMFQYIRFARSIILSGTVPPLQDWLFCLAFSLASLAFGFLVFHRSQDRFILRL